MKAQKIIGLSTSFLVVAMTFLAILFQQNIVDWWKLREYVAPLEISKLVTATGMNETSRHLFYINHPVIADRATFNDHCRDNEYTIVLGCYLPGQRGIYLLDVTDSRIEGVEEVTAAHEMLHAAYERLNTKERTRVDKLLSDAFDNLDNTRVRETIELYRKQDPQVIPNELHSILGTEVRNLPDELEVYYARYFSDRSRVVGFSEQYEQVFIERKNAVRDYDTQLANLNSQIDILRNQLEQLDADLRSQRAVMDQYKASGQLAAHDAQVPSYNAKIRRFNADADKLNSLVDQFNTIVELRTAIATEEAELVKAIDSREVVPDQR